MEIFKGTKNYIDQISFSLWTKKKLLGIFCWIVPLFAFAQVKDAVVDFYTERDGLANKRVKCLYPLENGTLLVGTAGGLYLYDGYDFTLINSPNSDSLKLSNDFIFDLEVDADQNIWVGTRDGLNIINTKENSIEKYFVYGKTKLLPRSKDGAAVLIQKGIDDVMWLVVGGKLYKAKDRNFIPVLPEKINEIIQFVIDKEGNICLLSNEEQFYKLNKDGGLLVAENLKTLFEHSAASKFLYMYGLPSDDIVFFDFEFEKALKLTKENRIIEIPLEDSYVYSLNQEAKKFVKFSQLNNLIGDFSTSKDGVIWVATQGGLMKLTHQKQYFEQIDALTGTSCRGMFEDAHGYIYVGNSGDSGVFRFHPQKKLQEWLPELGKVFSFVPLRGDTILCNRFGVSSLLFSTKSQKIIGEIPLKEFYFSGVFTSEQALWLTSNNGLSKGTIEQIDEIEPIEFEIGHPLNNASVLYTKQLLNGDLGLATTTGFYLYTPTNGQLEGYSNQEISHKKIASNLIRHFYQDEAQHFWLATTGGLQYIDPIQESTRVYDVEDGLCDNTIYAIIPEQDTILWLATSKGLSRFNTVQKTFNNYGLEDGIIQSEFNTSAYLKATDGTLYFGGINGVTIVRPEQIPLKNNAFQPIITKLVKYDLEQDKLNTAFLTTTNLIPLEMSPSEKYIEIYFSNTDFYRPGKSVYACYLEGFEKKWIPIGDVHSRRYTNLDEGKYNFKLRAANADGTWSTTTLNVPLIVDQYFYEQNWFWILSTFLIMASLIGLYYFYVQGQNEITIQRNQMARDLHDEVSNTLNNIGIVANKMEQNYPTVAQKELLSIQRMSTSAIEHVKDVIWAVDSKYDVMKHLIFSMEDFLDEVIRSQNIPVQFQKSNIDTQKKLNVLIRQNLLLIFKEAISNSVKHTNPTAINIHLDNKGNGFEMKIINEFESRKKAIHSTGRGLRNMEERAKHIQGTLTTEQLPNQFMVHLTLNRKI